MFVNVDYHLTDIIIPNTLDYITQGQTGDATEDIFGDAITEDMGKILASVYDSDEEVYEDIKKLYEKREIETFIIGMDSIDSTLKRTKEIVLRRNQQDHKYQYIHDKIAELQGWDCFQQNQFNLVKAKFQN